MRISFILSDMSDKIKKAGFILINKPSGITSHDVVEELRKITGIKKIGHSGTLDPFSTGLLILGISREATKRLSCFLKLNKEYVATIKLGFQSNTFDKEGEIVKIKIAKPPTLREVKSILKTFSGKVEQRPPIFSAKKINGKKACEMARKGEEVKLKPQEVKIYKISILNYKFPLLEIKIKCSSGTYIRSLASNIGKKLGCGGYLDDLTRTKIGPFSLRESVSLSKLNFNNWQNYLI